MTLRYAPAQMVALVRMTHPQAGAHSSTGSDPVADAGGRSPRSASGPPPKHPRRRLEPRNEQVIGVLLRGRRGVRRGDGTAMGALSDPSDGPRIPWNGS